MSYSWQGGSRKTEEERMSDGHAAIPPYARRLVVLAWPVCFVLAGLLLVWLRAVPEVRRSIPAINSHTTAAREDVPEGVRRLNLSIAVFSKDCSVLYVPSHHRSISLDTRTGAIHWRTRGGGGLALADEGALVNAGTHYNGSITAFDPVTGAQVWWRHGSDELSVPVAGPGALIAVRGLKTGLFGIDARDGKTIWHAEIPGIQRPAVGSDGTVFFNWFWREADSTVASVLCACDSRTGQMRWKRRLDSIATVPRLGPSGNVVLAAWKPQQSIYILSASDGAIVKRFDTVAPAGQLDVGPDGAIYTDERVGKDSYYLRSVNPRSGKLQWRIGEKNFYFRRCAFGLPGFVYAAGYLVHRDVDDGKSWQQHDLRALDAKTGKTLWSFTGSHDPRETLFDPLVGPDGTVYVGFCNHPHSGYVYALDGRTCRVTWERDLQS